MSNPPPFSEGRRKGSNTTLIILIVLGVLVVGCLLLIGMGAFFGLSAVNNIKPMAGCMVATEAIHDSLRDYASEHNGKLPSALKWQDELRPYVKKNIQDSMKDDEGAEWIIQIMDPDKPWGCFKPSSTEMTGLVFNEALSEVKVDNIESKATTVIVFESEEPPVLNAHKAFTRLDPDRSPEIMGKRRGWFEVTWDDVGLNGGETNMNIQTGRRRTRIRSSGDSEPSNSDPEASPATSN